MVRFEVLAQPVHQRRFMTGLKSPEEFVAYQLAWELKERVFAFTAAAPAVEDRKFCDEIREAARSAPDNISEGYYRFNPPDFANFVRIARGSLGEVRNQLKHARSKTYLSEPEFQELFHLSNRAIGAATGLRVYLLDLPREFDPRKDKGWNVGKTRNRARPKPRNRNRNQEPPEPPNPLC